MIKTLLVNVLVSVLFFIFLVFDVFNVLIFLHDFCVLLSLVLYRMSVYLYFHLHFTHFLVLTLVFMVIFTLLLNLYLVFFPVCRILNSL